MPTAKLIERTGQPFVSSAARRVFSFPVLLGVLLVAGACVNRYLNLMNVSLHQHVYSAYSFEGDMWWHIVSGKWILQNHSWPTHDFHSFTDYGSPWIAIEWLGEVLIAIFWELGGMRALMVLLIASASLVILLLYYNAYIRSGSVKAAFVACALLLPLAFLPFSMRPQIFGYAFLIVTLISMERFRQGHRKALWVLPPLFLIWVNTHGTFVLGFAILGVYWLAGLRELHLGQIEAVPWTPRERRHILTISLLCLLACVITPYGTRLAAYPIAMSIFQRFSLHVTVEFQPLDFALFYGKWFLMLLFVFMVWHLVTRKRIRLAELVLLLLATAVTLLHARFMLLFVPIFAPVLASMLAEWKWLKPGRPGGGRYALNAALMAIACGVVVFFFPSRARLQQAVELWSPVGAVRYLREHPEKGHMFNFDDWGGYLENLGQEVFIDGRTDISEPRGVLADYLQIVYARPRTLFLLRKYDIDSCLIPPDVPLATLLAALPNWKLVYRDNTSDLFTKTKNIPGSGPVEEIRIKTSPGGPPERASEPSGR